MAFQVDVNCDLGESYGSFKVGNDAEIMPCVTSVNIACGFHAGDPLTIAHTIALAKKHRVAVGAHPGYPDLMGFGRREMQITYEEAKSYIIYQVGALQGFAKVFGITLQHVKPHGAMYNKALKNEELAEAIAEAILELNSNLIVFAPPKSVMAKRATKAGLRVAYEFFADRAYNPDGSLVPRKMAGSVIEKPGEVVERTLKAITEGVVEAVNGEIVELGTIHTICVHSDTPTAPKIAQALRSGLIKAGIEVKSVGQFI
ncbi:MAG: LamB/YcsF family protein [Candidatus Bathyarchaeota archaeon]|nr:LamB/YcsF family protein [Candidatus Bathyarchaeota archaeon]MDW8040232.1 5-oxoprolinase subunit PxpA [Nitrososphaerota archaeon]